MSARETRRLDKKQQAIENKEAKAKSDGTVTAAERQRLHKMQRQSSCDIARQKHDANTVAPGAKN